MLFRCAIALPEQHDRAPEPGMGMGMGMKGDVVGTIEYRTLPVPAFDEHTVKLVAGPVTFGVEYRHLDEATILAFYGPDSRAKFDNVRPAGMGEVVEEDGLSLHVFESANGAEVLRFDCFDDAPHYHLLDAERVRNVVVEHDTAAGSLLDWALQQLRDRLPELLTEAGADELARQIDVSVTRESLESVAQVARYVLAAGRPVRVRSTPN
jgi:hypothetical protein